MAFRLVPISANAITSGILSGQYTLSGALGSPNYVHGVSGFAIAGDGSAEFNNVQIRGSTTTQGITLFYNGAPALGNLIMSLAPAAGADSFGNTYPQGVGITGTGGALTAKQGNNLLQIIAQAPAVTFNPNTLTLQGGVIQGQDGGTFGTLVIGSPSMLTGTGIQALLTMSSDVAAGTGRNAEFNCLLIVDKQIQVGSTTSTALVATGAATATTTSYSAMVTGEASSRWIMDASGKQGWGPGVSTRDTFLYRAAAGVLATTNALKAEVAAAVETWHPMTLQNAWVNSGAPDVAASYRLVPSPASSVQIVGTIKSGTTGALSITIATLPAAYWPASNQHFPIMLVGAANVAGTEGFLDTAGNVKITATTGATRVDFNAILPLDI